MGFIFVISACSLFLQISIHKIGLVNKLELYFNWCDWCFRFWFITIISYFLLPLELNSFIIVMASSWVAHILDKIEVKI